MFRFASIAVFYAVSLSVFAQSYPSKPIRVVIPYAPGGGVDRMGRLMAPLLGNALGQPVIIENQGGAATMIGTSMVGRAPADGHTLLFTTNGFSVNVLVHPSPSYKVEEFVAVAPVAVFAYILGVNPNVPARNVQEFIAWAKKEPAKVNAGAVGQGSAMHLLNERFETLSGIVVPEVHYRGLAPALADLMGGQVQMLKGGKVRGLAVTSPERSPLVPEVPTFREAGIPGMTQLGWQGVFAPLATPIPVVDRLNREIVKIATSPEIRVHFEPEGLSPLDLSREAFGKFVRDDAAPWERIVKALGIKMTE
jgi:tripartite-type tricarboxylate transporter receptor subunit TctC